jgi:hypothetical protein
MKVPQSFVSHWKPADIAAASKPFCEFSIDAPP